MEVNCLVLCSTHFKIPIIMSLILLEVEKKGIITTMIIIQQIAS